VDAGGPNFDRWVAYLLGFAPLYSAWGAGVVALSALPIVAAGFLLGLLTGLIIWVLSLPVNALLWHLAGQPVWEMLSAAYPSARSVLAISTCHITRDFTEFTADYGSLAPR
jgi:hypothetical protein